MLLAGWLDGRQACCSFLLRSFWSGLGFFLAASVFFIYIHGYCSVRVFHFAHLGWRAPAQLNFLEGRSAFNSSLFRSRNPHSASWASQPYMDLLGGRGAAKEGLLPLVVHLGRQVANLHVHGLVFLVLGRNGAQTVFDLVPRHGHIFPFDAVGEITFFGGLK